MKVCGENFKVKCDPFNCDCVIKVCAKGQYVRKDKIKFLYWLNNCKCKHRTFKNRNQKAFQRLCHNHYCFDGHITID